MLIYIEELPLNKHAFTLFTTRGNTFAYFTHAVSCVLA